VTNSTQIELNRDILRRLATIEDCLGLAEVQDVFEAEPMNDLEVSSLEEFPEDPALTPLWEAMSSLMKMSSVSGDAAIWHKSTIKYLWQSYVTLSISHTEGPC
jgi:hypothetical protein